MATHWPRAQEMSAATAGRNLRASGRDQCRRDCVPPRASRAPSRAARHLSGAKSSFAAEARTHVWFLQTARRAPEMMASVPAVTASLPAVTASLPPVTASVSVVTSVLPAVMPSIATVAGFAQVDELKTPIPHSTATTFDSEDAGVTVIWVSGLPWTHDMDEMKTQFANLDT